MIDHTVATAIEGIVEAISQRPAAGQGTAVTTVRLGEHLACQITDGAWTLTAGAPTKYGGSNAGPNPGILGRAALGSCLALGYAMWAARLGVTIDSLVVEVHADYDARGELGVNDDIRPGYSAIRYVVSVSSPASAAEVQHWLDIADRHSSWRDTIANPVPVNCERRVTTTGH